MVFSKRPRKKGQGFSGVDKRVVFQKGGFGGCFPGTKSGTRVRSPNSPERKPGTKTRTRVCSPKPHHPFRKPPFYLESVSVHPAHGNPRTGLLRTFWERDRVLRSPFRGLCVQGVLSCPTRRASLCTLYTETPERAF